MFDETELRKRFWQLEDEEKVVRERSRKLRQDRELLLSKIQPLEAELREVDVKIKSIERPALPALLNEKAMIARALKNKVGARMS